MPSEATREARGEMASAAGSEGHVHRQMGGGGIPGRRVRAEDWWEEITGQGRWDSLRAEHMLCDEGRREINVEKSVRARLQKAVSGQRELLTGRFAGSGRKSRTPAMETYLCSFCTQQAWHNVLQRF